MSKFKVGDLVKDPAGRGGVVQQGEADAPNKVWVNWDNNSFSTIHERLLSRPGSPEPKTLKHIDDIKEGAKYDLAGATLFGDSDGDLGVGTEEYGKYINKYTIGYLLEAGAKITILSEPEEATEPPYVDPDFKPGDWVVRKDAGLIVYYYLPGSYTEKPFVNSSTGDRMTREQLPEQLEVFKTYYGDANVCECA